MPRRLSIVVAVGLAGVVVGLVCWSFWPRSTYTLDAESPPVDRVKLAFERTRPIHFVNVPLEEAMEQLAQDFDVEIKIDRKPLSIQTPFPIDWEIDLQQPVTCQFDDVSLHAALAIVLRDSPLSYFRHGGNIVIAYPDNYYDDLNNYVGVVYTLAPTSPNSRAFGPEMLAEMIRWTSSYNWSNVGGTGEIIVVPGGVVVVHLREVHEQIKMMIEQIDHWRDSPSRITPILLTPIAPPSPDSEKIEQALLETTSAEFVETPLEDVAEYFSQRHHIPIDIDTRALEDVGIGTDTPVTAKLHGITLRSALRLLLEEVELTFYVRHGVLLITTPEEAEREMTHMVYPVWDLVSTMNDVTKDRLPNWITSVIRPQTWDVFGGPGSIDWLSDDLLIVSQPEDVHGEIVELLSRIRGMMDPLKPFESFDAMWMAPVWRRDIVKALDRPWTKSIVDVRIGDLPKILSDTLHIPVQLDERALDDSGMPNDKTISLEACGSARDCLHRALRYVGLAVMLRDEVLMITTVEEMEDRLETTFFDVRNLIDPDFGLMDASALKRLLYDVHWTSWDAVGGPGTADTYGGILVVSHSMRTQFAVVDLLRYLHMNMAELQNMRFTTVLDLKAEDDDWLVFYVLQTTRQDNSTPTIQWLLQRFVGTAQEHALNDLLHVRLREALSSRGSSPETVAEIDRIYDTTHDPTRREQLIELLQYCGSAATNSLVKYLNEGNEGEQEAAIAAIGRLKTDAADAFPALLKYFQNKPSEHVFAAMHRVAPELTPQALPTVREMLKSTPNEEIEAISILDKMGPAASAAVPDLMMRITGDNHRRLAAVIGAIDPDYTIAKQQLADWRIDKDPKRQQQADRIGRWLKSGFEMNAAAASMNPFSSNAGPFQENPFGKDNSFAEPPEE